MRSNALAALGCAALFWFGAMSFSAQTPVSAPTLVKPISAEYISTDGVSIEKLVELGISRRADLQAARQRLAIAEGRLKQAGLRPNPTLNGQYSTSKIVGGENENSFSVGGSQTFEIGGKRNRRIAVAELEIQQIRAEIFAIERKLSVEIRTAYANALAAGRQTDVLERLTAANFEIVRASEARLKEGDVAPLDLNLVKVEAERLKIQTIQARADLETALLQLKNIVGAEVSEVLKLAPQSERPPRLDLGLNELTEIALKERADLQAAKIGEQLGTARIELANANGVPNIQGSVNFSRSREIIELPPTLGGDVVNRENQLSFGVSVDLPFFNRNQGEIAAATSEKLQAVKQREFLEREIKRDVAVAYRKYRAAAESLVVYSTQILPRAEENLRAIRAAYGYGEFSVFEVVNEQRRLTENVTGYNQSLRDYYNALNELELSLGAEIPAQAFAPISQSVLPDRDLAPSQIDREKFLKSIETVIVSPKKELSKIKNQ